MMQKMVLLFGLVAPLSGAAQKSEPESVQRRNPPGMCKFSYMNCTFACQDDQACWSECSAQYDACLGLGTEQ